jgi:hypothetical protein
MCPIAASEVTGCSKSNNYRESMTVQTFPLLVRNNQGAPCQGKVQSKATLYECSVAIND